MSVFDKCVNKHGLVRTYQQYFAEDYGLEITDTTQPLAVISDTENKKPIYLVPSLCYMAG